MARDSVPPSNRTNCTNRKAYPESVFAGFQERNEGKTHVSDSSHNRHIPPRDTRLCGDSRCLKCLLRRMISVYCLSSLTAKETRLPGTHAC